MNRVSARHPLAHQWSDYCILSEKVGKFGEMVVISYYQIDVVHGQNCHIGLSQEEEYQPFIHHRDGLGWHWKMIRSDNNRSEGAKILDNGKLGGCTQGMPLQFFIRM